MIKINHFDKKTKLFKNISYDSLLNRIRSKNKKITYLSKVRDLNVWIDIFNPSDVELLKISKISNIPVEEIKICLDPDEKPRIEINKEYNYNLIIIKVPYTTPEYTSTTTLGFFFKDNYVISVHIDKVSSVKAVFNILRLKKNQEFQPLSILRDIIYYSLRNFSGIFDSLEKDTDRLEEEIFKVANIDLEIFLSMKETMIYFRKALASNRDVLSLILKKHLPVTVDLLNDFEDLKNEIDQLIEIEDILRDRITSSLDVYLSLASNRMNETMKTLTVLASLLVFPTLVSSIYGMNFKYMPLLDHPLGFWFSILIMFGGVLILLVFFKIRKMI